MDTATEAVRSRRAASARQHVRPGLIESRLSDFLGEDNGRAFQANTLIQVTLDRIGTADEAAAVALFLLSDDASYVTGSQYSVYGSMIML